MTHHYLNTRSPRPSQFDHLTLNHRICTDDEEHRKILWGSRIQQDPPTVAYEDVMGNDDRGLYKWLSNIVREHYLAFCIELYVSIDVFRFQLCRRSLGSHSLPACLQHLKLRKSYLHASDLFVKLSVRHLDSPISSFHTHTTA